MPLNKVLSPQKSSLLDEYRQMTRLNPKKVEKLRYINEIDASLKKSLSSGVAESNGSLSSLEQILVELETKKQTKPGTSNAAVKQKKNNDAGSKKYLGFVNNPVLNLDYETTGSMQMGMVDIALDKKSSHK